MDAQTGKEFLTLLLSQELMDASDLEEAIRIASEKNPSSAIKVAERYFVAKHGWSMEGLAFGKGTRWLAMIRRDSGPQVFENAVAQLRGSGGGPGPKSGKPIGQIPAV